jgi:restriction system protein
VRARQPRQGRQSARRRTQRRRRNRRIRRLLRRIHPLVYVAIAAALAFAGYEAYLFVRAHPVAVALTGAGIAALAALAFGGTLALRRRRRPQMNPRASVDAMTGPEFEHYVAGLMRRTGFRSVQVTGRAADLGADITAETADGRRVVVQCKRYAGTVGSPHVQRLNGTAWTIHRADVTLLVTTGRLSTHALDLAVRCGITVVDRAALAAWVASNRSPV